MIFASRRAGKHWLTPQKFDKGVGRDEMGWEEVGGEEREKSANHLEEIETTEHTEHTEKEGI